MVVTFDTPAGKHTNTSSCAQFMNYMEKENKNEVSNEKWFGERSSQLYKCEVQSMIDKDKQGIGRNEGKFTTGSINPTEKEWNSFGRTEEERTANFKSWIKEQFTKEFAKNFNKKDKKGNIIDIKPENVKIFYKLENNRYYKGDNKEVKQGLKKQNEIKEGFNKHVHFIVARKTLDGKNRICPTTKNRKEFCRVDLINNVEKSMDKQTGYKREIKDSFEYSRIMENGTAEEKINLLNTVLKEEQNKKANNQKQKELPKLVENEMKISEPDLEKENQIKEKLKTQKQNLQSNQNNYSQSKNLNYGF